MLPKRFNDLLALVLVALIFGLWAAILAYKLPGGEILGATITVLGLIANFYFRKSPPPEPKP